MKSIIIPIYKNEKSIPRLLKVLDDINKEIKDDLEVVFVIDGSPDNSLTILKNNLYYLSFSTKIITHSKNFGAIAAVRTGLSQAGGDFFSVLAADLQEPPELIIKFFDTLEKDSYDVVVGKRLKRYDPFFSRVFSNFFWFLYKKVVFPEMPEGGVDAFGCNRKFRDELVKLKEARSSLISQIFWMGFKRKEIDYIRLKREEGVSSQNLSRKFEYMFDCIFSFTDLPIRILIFSGFIGIVFSLVLAFLIFINALLGFREVPGYATTVISILFFGALNIFGLGMVGSYSWRSYENTKNRPLAIISDVVNNDNVLANKKSNLNQITNNLVYKFKSHIDHRGVLTVCDHHENLPFNPHRHFYISNVPDENITRGGHAHIECKQFLICIKGECVLEIDDGQSQKKITLNSIDKGVYVPNMVWNNIFHFTSDAILLVFASHSYDIDDYIDDYNDFIKRKKHEIF